MAYVRTKKVKGWEYHQLVESRRVDGEPRQKVLMHLGRHASVNAALKEWPNEIRRLRSRVATERKSAADWPEGSRARRNAIKQADRAEQRANELKANLEELRRLRKQGVV